MHCDDTLRYSLCSFEVDPLEAIERMGFRLVRQVGSHIVLRRDDPFAQVVVPDHCSLDRGALRSILRSAGLRPEQFRELL